MAITVVRSSGAEPSLDWMDGWMDGLGKIGACGKLKSIKSRHKSIINGISRDKREDEEIVVGWTN